MDSTVRCMYIHAYWLCSLIPRLVFIIFPIFVYYVKHKLAFQLDLHVN